MVVLPLGLALALGVSTAIGCAQAPSGPSAEHARAMARYEAVMAETLDPSYASPAFDEVVGLLRAVPPSATEHQAAALLAGEIEVGRARQRALEAGIVAAQKARVVVPETPEPVEARPVPPQPADPAPPPAPADRPIAVTAAAPAPAAAPTPSQARTRVPSGPLVLYTTAWCGYCKRAKAHLTRNNVTFVEKDVEASESNARESSALRQKHGLGTGVPMIDADGVVTVGYSAESLDALLVARGYR